MLERAAVIGREFTAGAVNSLSGDQPVGSTLLSLVRRDLIEPDRSLIPGDDGFRFRHILIRDAAYLGVAKASRAELHERYADWLARSAGELDEIIGYHLEQAFRYRQELGAADDSLAAQAGERLARAGRRAVGRGDLPAAVTLLTRAAALLPDSHEQRREILPILGGALMRTGDFTRAERFLDEALESAQAAGDRRLELRTLIEREFFRAFTQTRGAPSRRSSPSPTAHPAPRGARRRPRPREGVVAEERGACQRLPLGPAGARISNARSSTPVSAGDAGESATLAAQLVQALYYGPTPVDEAIARCEELLAERPDDRSLSASVTGAIAGLRAMRGDLEQARRLQAKARALDEQFGQRFRIAARAFDRRGHRGARRSAGGGDRDLALGVRRAAGDGHHQRGVHRWPHTSRTPLRQRATTPKPLHYAQAEPRRCR